MKNFTLSLQSEFFKSKNTLAFWGAIILPVFLCFLVFGVYFFKADDIIKNMKNPTPEVFWFEYFFIILGVMGSLLLPMYLIFMTYSVNNIEHKAETWKSLFSLPIPKFTVYASKALYCLILVFLTLLLFLGLSIGLGLLLGKLAPNYHLLDADLTKLFGGLTKIYIKLFLSSLAIVAIQFLFSLIWADFMKPMGFGFVALITCIILLPWEYSYILPYSLPSKVLSMGSAGKEIIIFNKEAFISIGYAVAFFIFGYFVITKRSVK
jgi:hypothetical protein